MRVRRVCQARNLALDILRKYSIFDSALSKDGKKLISIAIVGLGSYGVELLKSICWCGQMDGYTLEIHIFDEDKDSEVLIQGIAPELISYNHMRIDGEPLYDIYFHNNVNVKEQVFLDELSSIKNISTVYVTLGDDELNIETAMRMRMQFGRDKIKYNREIPPVFAVVYSSIKSATFKQNGGLKSIKNIDYGIQFVGSMKDRYSLHAIEQPELEADGLEVHMSWVAKSPDEIKNEALLSYEKFEYHRRASMSQALHIRFREKLGLLYEEDLDSGKILEHKRWNAYMRAEGYVFDIIKDDIAKTHHNLVPYEKLSEEDKNKDIIVKLSKNN